MSKKQDIINLKVKIFDISERLGGYEKELNALLNTPQIIMLKQKSADLFKQSRKLNAELDKLRK